MFRNSNLRLLQFRDTSGRDVGFRINYTARVRQHIRFPRTIVVGQSFNIYYAGTDLLHVKDPGAMTVLWDSKQLRLIEFGTEGRFMMIVRYTKRNG